MGGRGVGQSGENEGYLYNVNKTKQAKKKIQMLKLATFKIHLYTLSIPSQMHTPNPYIFTIFNTLLYRASKFAFSISLSCNASISPFVHQFSAEPPKTSSFTSSSFKLSSAAQG